MSIVDVLHPHAPSINGATLIKQFNDDEDEDMAATQKMITTAINEAGRPLNKEEISAKTGLEGWPLANGLYNAGKNKLIKKDGDKYALGPAYKEAAKGKADPAPAAVVNKSKKPHAKRAQKAAKAAKSVLPPPMPNGGATPIPRFGVFSDGTVRIEASSCTGSLTRDEVQALFRFAFPARGKALPSLA